ncbi:hypothetical protein L249_8714 [Ophiocordyceps polyrhachis-furcata BCC 54312]|uniref:Uncharacterized protein n=1 Tax=Ophiocordyceps polyrhachis-furcata BCC 54312 TaxID=1330021 RepID=A0A367L6K4_9HYPO|nr:hypothetical protein L249_8714 [Ophiocordyceps polyrhachis-furcata BCC 54312]
MSRNIRQKLPPVASKRRRRSTSSSSPNLSDDDGYSAVEDISDDDDDDEEDVNAAEEKNIMTEAYKLPSATPRPQPEDEDAADEDEDENDADDDEDDDDDYGDDGGDNDFDASFDDATKRANGLEGFTFDLDTNPTHGESVEQRHVHFAVPSSDSDDTDSDDAQDDLFPDIFISQRYLDNTFRREIEGDADGSDGSGSSYWDFAGQYGDYENAVVDNSDDEAAAATLPLPMPSTVTDVATASEGVQGLDGYESDGDTTEDDVPEPLVCMRTRRPSNPSSEQSDGPDDVVTPIKGQRGKPRVGRFSLDRLDKKPIVVMNPQTRKMMIFTPLRRRTLDLSPEQFNLPYPVEPRRLFHDKGKVLTTMFSSNTFGDFVNAQNTSTADNSLPVQSDANTGCSDANTGCDSSVGEASASDGEENLDIDDFISWGEDGTSGEDGNRAGKWEPSSTAARRTTSSGNMDVLSHLNPDTVGAFRRNQIDQQLILSNQATRDSLVFSGPYNYTALRGIKSDRFDTAGLPLTPIRRQRKHVAEAGRSPLDSLSAKRKASGDVGAGHKRHRSISEVKMLRI